MRTDPVLEDLMSLFERMERIYAEHAEAIGLSCVGCTDNCCRTHFHHHTIVEQMLLAEGLRSLDSSTRKGVIDRARHYVEELAQADAEDREPELACPLLEDNRCMLYEHRLMICRLHGTPWVLNAGKEAGVTKPGCARAMACIASLDVPPPPLDRTPLFLELAEIERRARTATGRDDRVNLSIAGMILLLAEQEGWE